MTEHESRELARIERELNERVDSVIRWAKWLLGGIAGASLLVLLTTIPWIWMLSSRTVTLQERTEQHAEIFRQRAGYLPRVDALEARVAVALEEIRRTLDRLERRQQSRDAPARE